MWQWTAASNNKDESQEQPNDETNENHENEMKQEDDNAVALVVLTAIPSPSSSTQQQHQQQPQYQLQVATGRVLAYHPPGIPNARQPALWRLQFPTHHQNQQSKEAQNTKENQNEDDDHHTIIVAVDVVRDQYNQARELAAALNDGEEDNESRNRIEIIPAIRPTYEANLARLYHHVQQAWHSMWLEQYLPKCIVLSALEEGLFQVLQQYHQHQQQQQQFEASTTSSSITTNNTNAPSLHHMSQPVPRYYTTYPTQYLIPPPHPNDVASSSTTATTATTTLTGVSTQPQLQQQQPIIEVSISSSALLSRIKQALSLAVAASSSSSGTAAATASAAGLTESSTPMAAATTTTADDEAMAAAMSSSDASMALRRSRRATTPSSAAVASVASQKQSSQQSSQQQQQQPMVVQKGGRIAMWLLQQMEQELQQQQREESKSNTAETDDNGEASKNPEPTEDVKEEKEEALEKQKGEETKKEEEDADAKEGEEAVAKEGEEADAKEDETKQPPPPAAAAEAAAKDYDEDDDKPLLQSIQASKSKKRKRASLKNDKKSAGNNNNDNGERHDDGEIDDEDDAAPPSEDPKDDDDYQSEKEVADDEDDDVLQDVVREHKEDLADVVVVDTPSGKSQKGKRGKKRGRPPKAKPPGSKTPASAKRKKGKLAKRPEEEEHEPQEAEQQQQQEDVEMVEVDDHLEDEDIVFSNPYFVQPTLRDVVEWLGRGQRGGGGSRASTLVTAPALATAVPAELPLTPAHLQEAMAKCCWRPEPIKQQKGKSKRNTVVLPTSVLLAESRGSKHLIGLSKSDLISVDQVVLKEQRNVGYRLANSESSNGQDDRLVVLECQSPLDIRPKDIPKLDSAVFARSKFSLRMVDRTERSLEQIEEWRQEQLQEWQRAEQAFKKAKNWATWRYKGIHGGYTVWPSWEQAALEWCLSHNAPKESQVDAAATTEAQATESSKLPPIGSPAAAAPRAAGLATTPAHAVEASSSVPSQELADMALAQSLAAASEDQTLAATMSGGIRRTARRTAATGTGESGIFYGSQSSMTQKQLMDTVLRLVQLKSFQTLIGLRSVVIEESSSSGNSNPIQRMRAALGKLVWKQNRLATHAVTTKWSEDHLLARLEHAPLLTIEEAILPPPQPVVVPSVTKGNLKTENGNEETLADRAENGSETAAVEPVLPPAGEERLERESTKEAPSDDQKPDNGNGAAALVQPVLSTAVADKPDNGNDVPPSMMVSSENEVPSAAQPAVLSDGEPKGETEIEAQNGTIDELHVSGGDDTKFSAGPTFAGNKAVDNFAVEHKDALVKYIQSLHNTELHLRKLILQQLSPVPVHVIAAAADERPGTMEALDATFFEEDGSDIEWLKTGHELLSKVIYRPSQSPSPIHENSPHCQYYKIKAFTPSVASNPNEEGETPAPEPVVTERGLVGGTVVQEPPGVERRIRFRAVPLDGGQQEVLILTEAQVRAGIVAAELEKKLEKRRASSDNPLATIGAQVTLYPNDGSSTSAKAIRGRVVGHNSIQVKEDGVDEFQHRVLILPDPSSIREEAFWVTLQDASEEDSTIICQPVNEPTLFKVQQSDFHSTSQAFQECQAMVDFLRRQPRSMPFLEPVDPVALNVPEYFQIVKHPMDISTLEKKLKSGQYSIIPPQQNPDRSPTARMLNGPFRDDAVLIFNNAMLFNPPNDWIHQAAATIKKNLLKKIDQVSASADLKQGRASTGTRTRTENKSVYVDEDSDVDIYDYESDRDEDDDYGGGRGSQRRKRKRPPSSGAAKARVKDDYAARPLEYPIRLANTMSDATSLRGPMANFPVNLDAASFTLPPEWNCRFASAKDEPDVKDKLDEEISSLVALQKLIEDTEVSALRRSTRSHGHDDPPPGKSLSSSSSSAQGGTRPVFGQADFEYFVDPTLLPPVDSDHGVPLTASNRLELELARERLHEEYYAKLHQQLGHLLSNNNGIGTGSSKLMGTFANGSFPPYLGRVVPAGATHQDDDELAVHWEIRAPYVIPALRWVLRGLIRSGHISEVDPLTSDANPNAGVILLNHVYWIPPQLCPYEVLDVKEMQRRKRATTSAQEEEEVVEMSDYEKMRAERVARNAERLKALGLA